VSATAEVRGVLDASAVLSYARGHVHVGELLVEIAEDGAVTALPTVALFDAYSRLTDAAGRGRVGVLAALPGVEALALAATDAASAAPAVRLTGGDLGRAHAVWVALHHGAYLLTCEPGSIPAIVPREQVHAIPVDDA
jgi:hypothetical protein